MTIHEALRKIASLDQDGARARNHAGFSGHDTGFANKLAAAASLSAKQEWYAAKFVRKYRVQLASLQGVNLSLKGKAKEAAITALLTALEWQHTPDEVIVTANKPAGTIKAVVGEQTGTVKYYTVYFPYSASLVAALKNHFDWRDRMFNAQEKRWEIKPSCGRSLLGFARTHNFEIAEPVARLLDA